MHTAIVWFRRDLRLADHLALAAAAAGADRVVPLYIHAPEEEGEDSLGGASRWWLHHTLIALDTALRERGSRLIVAQGPSLDTLRRIATATGATSIHWNRSYEPAVVRRDKEVKAALREAGLTAESYAGNLLFEPWTVKNLSGEPFRVFTPFWRNCQKRLAEVPLPLRAPSKAALGACPDVPGGVAVQALGLLPTVPWDAGFRAAWKPGEAGAHARLRAFLNDDVADYDELRNRPDLPGSSRLSPHLHFGEISPRQIVAATQQVLMDGRATGARGVESFVREVGWREFAQHVLYAFPHTVTEPMDGRFRNFAWRDDAASLAAWQGGRTGIPMVDAGMRELWHTGWMHNRVRMIVASFLTKNLGHHWREGARWFNDTLVDADLASNTMGWQWTAGCGVDAAPFYRIFSPVLQSERFDPARAYVRRWVPELARLPDKWIHRPDAASPPVLAAAGVLLGRTYPRPIVDLAGSRDRALATWQATRGAAPGAEDSAPPQPAPVRRPRP